ncbi:hypothetical protein [Marinobacter sp.]|uniref:hypothetical protein n=1 Tax=Marinobacter sp. TaxID=50741 RepID=UPI003A8D9B29
MTSIAIAATTAYRSKVALRAAEGGQMPRASELGFGSGAAPYTLGDTTLAAEWLRVPTTNTTAGPVLTVTGVLSGAQAGASILREVGVFDEEGTLMGRRVLTPKELEPETQLEFEIIFQY